MRYSFVCFFVMIFGLNVIASDEIGKLEWAIFPTPETTTCLPEELKLRFYGIQDGKWSPSGVLPDEWNEYITLKDAYGNIIPIRACYAGYASGGAASVSISLWDEYSAPGKYILEIKEGIYMNRVNISAPYIPSPNITIEYELGGNWFSTNDLSVINPSEYMYIPTDSYLGSEVPYITKEGRIVATCSGYRCTSEYDLSKYLFFDNDHCTPGIYELIIPAHSIGWGEGESVQWNEYTEVKFKLISPLKNMFTWPAKGAKVVNPNPFWVVLPECVCGIYDVADNKYFEIYKDGKFIGTRRPSSVAYNDSEFRLTGLCYDDDPGSYKIIIPANTVKIGEFGKYIPDDIVFEYEIVEVEEVESISTPDFDNTSVEMYDLSGKKVSGEPTSGIYVVRTPSTTQKIIVK